MISYPISIYQQCTLLMKLNEQHVLLSNLKLLTAVRNGDMTLAYLSSYEIECLIASIATLQLLQFYYYHHYCISYVNFINPVHSTLYTVRSTLYVVHVLSGVIDRL